MPARKKARRSASSGWGSRAPAWISERKRSTPARRGAKKTARKAASRRAPAKRAPAKRAAASARKTTKPARRTATRSVAARKAAKTPARKKTAARTKTAARRTATARRVASRTAKRTTTSTTKRTPRSAPSTADAISRELLAFDASGELITSEVEAVAQPSIGIAGVTPASLAHGEEETPMEAPPAEMERRRDDLPLAALSALLAASVFLPWYRYAAATSAKILNANGWQTGTWGPVIFFLGVGSLALVVLRRLRIRVNLPFPETVVQEAIGWISTITAIVKARLRPAFGPAAFNGQQHMSLAPWIWSTVLIGLALALVAGRASGRTPFVSVPGWWKGRAGAIGVALIVAVVGGSAAFAFTNSVKTSGSIGGVSPGATGRSSPSSSLPSNSVRGKLPDCMKGFPLPSGLTPEFGYSNATTCGALLQTTMKAADVVAGVKAALAAAHYNVKETANRGVTRLDVKGSRCGVVTIVAQSGATASGQQTQASQTFVSVVLVGCQQNPSP